MRDRSRADRLTRRRALARLRRPVRLALALRDQPRVAYRQAFGGLLAALAVTVALAIVNGERHRGRYRSFVRSFALPGLS